MPLAGPPVPRWHLGIGDPSPAGWLTVVAYCLAAGLCWLASQRARPRRAAQAPSGRPTYDPVPLLWSGLCGLLVLLGLNKQLDLQTLMTDLGRQLAYAQGWYEQRRWVQVIFIGSIGALSTVGLATVLWLARGRLGELRLALLGSVLLCSFVVVRAASFHHVGQAIGIELGGLRVNWMLELGGILLISLGAAFQGGALEARQPES